MRIRHTGREDKTELQMTPMIDIVFQLLVFFILTFKIVLPEGDFNITMPISSKAKEQASTDLPPITVRLVAGEEGGIAAIELNGLDLGGATVDEKYALLRAKIVQLVGDDSGPDSARDDIEVELDFDYRLRYLYLMKAISHISGKPGSEPGSVVKLVEKIRFAAPKGP